MTPLISSVDAQKQGELEGHWGTYEGEDRVISSEEMRREIERHPKAAVKFHSPWPALEAMIEGFEGGELIALSGPTKNGKTLVAQSLMVHFAKTQVSSLYVSFEVPAPLFLKQLPIECEFYMPRLLVPRKPTWLSDKIMESKLKYNTRAIFIDHLHYLVDLAKGGRNLSIDIGEIVRGLKRAAVRHNIVIFLLCHSTKALTPTGEIRELGAFDIRDSSFVPQEADSTWIVQRKMDKDREFNNKAMLKVCNHRRTGAMEKRMTLVKSGLLFEQHYEPGEEPERTPPFFGDTLRGQEDGNDTQPY